MVAWTVRQFLPELRRRNERGTERRAQKLTDRQRHQRERAERKKKDPRLGVATVLNSGSDTVEKRQTLLPPQPRGGPSSLKITAGGHPVVGAVPGVEAAGTKDGVGGLQEPG